MPPSSSGLPVTQAMVQVLGVQILVTVQDPGHLPLGCTHVGRGHVFGRADVPPPDQLPGEPTGDPLEAGLVVLPGIDTQAALRPAEGDVEQGTLVGHECGQRLGMILVHVGRKAQPSLDRQAMGGVDGPPTSENLDAVAQTDREADLDHGGTGLQRVGGTLRYVQQRHGVFDHVCDAVSKSMLWNRVGHGTPPG